MKITRNLLTLSCLAITGLFSTQPKAQALTFSLDSGSPSGDVYSYSLTLEAGETLETDDILVLSNLESVTDTTATSPFEISTIGGGFSSTDAIFEVADGVTLSEPQTLSSVIQITSTASLDNVQYDLFTSSNSSSGTVTSATAVPFEFSPGLGIVIATSFLGLRYLKNRFTV